MVVLVAKKCYSRHPKLFKNAYTSNAPLATYSIPLMRHLITVFLTLFLLFNNALSQTTEANAAVNQPLSSQDKQSTTPNLPVITQAELAAKLQPGDLIFVRIALGPFVEVADASNSWTNHVGVVTSADLQNSTVSESTIPFSQTTTLAKFVNWSEQGRVAVTRLINPISAEQIETLKKAIKKRNGIFYDTGFDLYSNKQFCSRYAYEVMLEATGIKIGTVITFKEMFSKKPDINLAFWKNWYFGSIPWERETITPASLLESSETKVIFDGRLAKN